MKEPIPLGFTMNVNCDNGTLFAAYIKIREPESQKTVCRELVKNKAFADYNEESQLLGIEVLDACEFEPIEKIIDNEPGYVIDFVKNCFDHPLVKKIA